MNSLRKITTLTAIAAVGATGVASAATIGQPEVLGPGTEIPINFAAFKEPASGKLPANHRIVRKHIELKRGEKPSTVMTAPKGFKIITIGMGDGHQIGGVVTDTHYGGKRSVRVKLWANAKTGKGTLYLLARRA